MKLEHRRFQREFRKHGGFKLTWTEGPQIKPSVTLTTLESGKLHGVILVNTLAEVPDAIQSLIAQVDASEPPRT